MKATEVIEKLKQNFADCTYGGEDENYLMYDVGLSEHFAHVNVYKSKNKIIVKIYEPESTLINDGIFHNVDDVVKYLEQPYWRHLWNERKKLTNRDSKQSIEKWVSNNQNNYDGTIYIDEHPKDGWVAYLISRS